MFVGPARSTKTCRKGRAIREEGIVGTDARLIMPYACRLSLHMTKVPRELDALLFGRLAQEALAGVGIAHVKDVADYATSFMLY